MKIRPATHSDLPAITAIYGYHVIHGTGSFEYDPPSLDEMTARFTAIRDKDLPYLVMDIGGEVVGYAYASPYRPRIGYKYALEDSIYIKHGFEGRQIGHALLKEVISICTAHGYRQMIAAIGDIKNVGSIHLHRACGFVLVGTLPSSGWKHGRWLDSIFMQRALGDGDCSPPL